MSFSQSVKVLIATKENHNAAIRRGQQKPQGCRVSLSKTTRRPAPHAIHRK
jgi:hypothetical protein